MSVEAPAMRANPVRQRLRAGGNAFGVMAFEFFTPGLAPVLAASGAEFVLIDMEHSGIAIDTVKAQIAYAHGAGIVPMVRVTACAYNLIAPVLDAGALGIMQIDAERRITRFVEKPKETAVLDSLRVKKESYPSLGIKGEEELFLASMGIYVFKRDVLVKLLDNTLTDFGKHIIPNAIQSH